MRTRETFKLDSQETNSIKGHGKIAPCLPPAGTIGGTLEAADAYQRKVHPSDAPFFLTCAPLEESPRHSEISIGKNFEGQADRNPTTESSTSRWSYHD